MRPKFASMPPIAAFTSRPTILSIAITTIRQASTTNCTYRAPRVSTKIDLVNGKLDIDGVKGEVNGASVNGSVYRPWPHRRCGPLHRERQCQQRTRRYGSAHHVKLSSVNGHVEIAMPKDANAHSTANTVSGSISSDLALTIHKGWVGSDLDTTLGSGATRVELSNVNGSIKIHGGNAGS